MIDLVHPHARLLRGFAVDYLTAHDMTKLPQIMHPDYRLTIAGVVFDGRDEGYRPAAIIQLTEFPGLIVTPHDVLIGPDFLAMRYTEHGASRRYSGHLAAWGGITLFALRDGQIHKGWSESDYMARKRQLKSGIPDIVEAPHPAPWDARCVEPRGETEAVVRAWLDDPTSLFGDPNAEEISAGGKAMRELMTPAEVQLSTVFTAGDRAAFHLLCSGTYRGCLDEVEARLIGAPVTTGIAGIVTLRDGRITQVQYATDRLGFGRRLLDRKAS